MQICQGGTVPEEYYTQNTDYTDSMENETISRGDKLSKVKHGKHLLVNTDPLTHSKTSQLLISLVILVTICLSLFYIMNL
jgi:hypothetical protein